MTKTKTKTTLTRSIAILLLGVTLAACGDAASGVGTGSPSSNVGGGAGGPVTGAAYTMTGTVRNAAGQPLPGVEVWADNTLYYNMNALGTTDAQGRYSIALPRDALGTWRAGGRFQKKYAGQWYDLSLDVDNPAAFSADTGAVRDLTLRISGERTGGGFWGGTVYAYGSYGAGSFDLDHVELTLTPEGPLLDGSAGKVITTGLDGSVVRDVPIGQYRVSARYLPDGEAPRAMLVAPPNTDAYGTSATLTFEQSVSYGQLLDFNLKLAN
ncbi:hypothetical protein [Deinococcus pimensis]|uniref:hypothetical protein n=1 Tax=Deinococcus pimensis TaxID=309888 RepID=UPI0004B37C27|nr:hypothetical protein [Deinococcus pimensis]